MNHVLHAVISKGRKSLKRDWKTHTKRIGKLCDRSWEKLTRTTRSDKKIINYPSGIRRKGRSGSQEITTPPPHTTVKKGSIKYTPPQYHWFMQSEQTIVITKRSRRFVWAIGGSTKEVHTRARMRRLGTDQTRLWIIPNKYNECNSNRIQNMQHMISPTYTDNPPPHWCNRSNEQNNRNTR